MILTGVSLANMIVNRVEIGKCWPSAAIFVAEISRKSNLVNHLQVLARALCIRVGIVTIAIKGTFPPLASQPSVPSKEYVLCRR